MWRVSTVLSVTGLSTPYAFSEAARDRGTAVHAFNHAVATGQTPPVADDDPHAAYKQALLRWYEDFTPTVLAAELRLVSSAKRCTGRIDLAIAWRDQPIVCDIKTGDSSAAWHGIQVAGYVDLANGTQALHEAMLTRSSAIGPWQRAVLYLRSNGKYDWRGPVKLLRDGPQDDFLWRSALALVAWKYDRGLINIIDKENPDDDSEISRACTLANRGEPTVQP